MLTKLGFDARWLEYGLLDEQFLRELSERFDTSDDKNIEHYRYAAFYAVLMNSDALDDTLLDRYIHLAQLDEDLGMARSALIELISWRRLSDNQFEHLSKHPAFADPYIQRIVEKKVRLLRQLGSSDPLTDELFERCLASRNRRVQEVLLIRSDISRQQIEVLSQQGCGKAIRNMAKQRLNRRR